MNYEVPYERLGPGRFQKFCISLLTYEYRELQAFPLDYADGGRDGAVPSDGLCVQVKFASKPSDQSNPVQWLARAMALERPKMDRLAAAGVTHYRLVTNVIGSAQLEQGAMDRIDDALAKLPFSDVSCLWRPDLDNRLAHHPELKWTFYELLTGVDVLAEAAFGNVEERGRRERTLRGFLAAQRRSDRDINFSQIELQSDLLGLWIDVPLMERFDARALGQTYFGRGPLRPGSGAEIHGVGGAAFLLHGAPEETRRVTVLGAPGQGKSTLAQYVCQVHRLRILHDADANRLGADDESPLRLPVRLDLRDLSRFLTGVDPWNDVRLHDVDPTLTTFLARLITRFSDGDHFQASDVKAAAEELPLLLMLDGLDEVPTSQARNNVVDCIERGVATLEVLNPLLQVVVMSRPLFYSQSDRLPGPNFRTVTLGAVPRSLAIAYSKKWCAAKRKTDEKTAELVGELAGRLDNPDFQWLATNSMQLAIVLQLLDIHGDLLPTQRAKLYQSYMTLFLQREAHKSETIRTHQEEILDLHGYIAWRMHASAEGVAEDAGLSSVELRAMVEAWLRDSTITPSFVDELFHGVALRVMALVARSGDRFEFEVQPLREFLAAHHLYNTVAPGQEQGDLRGRFDAMLRNPYWGNVLTLFAGLFKAVERPALAERLGVLADDEVWGPTGRHAYWSTALLNDRSFGTSAPTVRSAVDLILGSVAARVCGTTLENDRLAVEHQVITEEYATSYALQRSMSAWAGGLPFDRRYALSMWMGAAAPFKGAQLRDWWLGETASTSDDDLSDWLIAGAMPAEPQPSVDLSIVAQLADRCALSADAAVALGLRSPMLVAAHDEILANAMNGLAGGTRIMQFRIADAPLARFAALLSRTPPSSPPAPVEQAHADGDWMSELLAILALDDGTWPGRALAIDEAYSKLGARICIEVAGLALSSAIRPLESGVIVDEAPASLIDFCTRLRARCKRPSEAWWCARAGAATVSVRRLMAMSLVAWADTSLIKRMASDLLDPMLEDLTDEEVRVLRDFINTRGSPLREPLTSSGLHPRLTMLLGERLRFGQLALADELAGACGEDASVAEWVGDATSHAIRARTPGSQDALERVLSIHARCPEWAPRIPQGPHELDAQLATDIWEQRESVPLFLVILAERTLDQVALNTVDQLQAIAARERWFERT